MSLELTNDKSTMVPVMAWCHQAPSHHLNQCRPSPKMLMSQKDTPACPGTPPDIVRLTGLTILYIAAWKNNVQFQKLIILLHFMNKILHPIIKIHLGALS